MRTSKRMVITIACVIVTLLIAGIIVFKNRNVLSEESKQVIDTQEYISDTVGSDKNSKQEDGKTPAGEDKESDSNKAEQSSSPGSMEIIDQTEEEFTIPEIEIKQDSENKGDSAPISVNTDGIVDEKKIDGFKLEDGKDIDISEQRIRIDSVGSYSGPYVEDGSDEEVKDILSIVVTNISDQFLQYSQITMSSGEKKAVFEVSNLPAGSSALVLASERTAAGEDWKYKDDVSAFIEAAPMHDDIFSWKGGDYTLILTNKSKDRYEKVYVYYKNTKNGIYVGGITYRILFEDMAAGQTLEKQSRHFAGSDSHVMMIDYIDD
ncbi:MAG: hypothetical protein ACI4E0_06395 [Blautia sp.]